MDLTRHWNISLVIVDESVLEIHYSTEGPSANQVQSKSFKNHIFHREYVIC